MSDRHVSRIAVTALLMSAIITIAFVPGLAYSSAIVAQTITQTVTTTLLSNSTSLTVVIFTRNMTTTESHSSNMTITSTFTTSMLSGSDLTTLGLAAVAVAALIIAVYSLLRRRASVRPPAAGPQPGPYPGAAGRALVCPSCGTSNKPSAAFCRRCRTRLR